jgi:hypothetical protein
MSQATPMEGEGSIKALEFTGMVDNDLLEKQQRQREQGRLRQQKLREKKKAQAAAAVDMEAEGGRRRWPADASP